MSDDDIRQIKSMAELLTGPPPDYWLVAQAAGYNYAYPYIPGGKGENCTSLVSMDREVWHMMEIEYRDDGIYIRTNPRAYNGTLMEVLELLGR